TPPWLTLDHGGRRAGAVGDARGHGAVQKARIIVPVTRATIVLIEVGSCARALWTRPKPTTSVTQANASTTNFRCVRWSAASSEKLFMTRSPKTSLSLVAASRRKVQPLAPIAQMDLTHSVNGSPRAYISAFPAGHAACSRRAASSKPAL